MEFKTQYNKMKGTPHPGGGPCLVDKAGYISAEKRINNLMAAGQRLVESRREVYDFPDGVIDEEAWDPTRAKNFDMADGTQLAYQVEARLKNAKIRDQEKKASEKLQEAQDEALSNKKAPE